MITHLLGAKAHHLDKLALWRVQLDQSMPAATVSGEHQEGVLYALTGTALIYADGQYLGSLGQRRRMQDEQAQAWRFRGCAAVTLTLSGTAFAADFLWITHTPYIGTDLPIIDKHLDDAAWHTVGDGTHLRRVADIPTPRGARIACGETHNIPGGISSWPPHATGDDIEQFTNGKTTWEEVMWFACDAPGIANLQGVYTGNIAVNKYREIRNGDAHVVPLGSHTIHAGPGASMLYVWAYAGTALQKQYNQAANDLGTYRK